MGVTIDDSPRPNTCHNCRAPVIWVQIKEGRGYRPIPLEVCADGTGDMAFFPSLFPDGSSPIAELVSNGTSYRSHREHCSAAITPSRSTSTRPAAAPAPAFSARAWGSGKMK